MDASLFGLINLYQFPTGRRMYAHEQMLVEAKTQGSAFLAEHIGQALAHDHHTHELERRWAQARTAGSSDKARVLDDQIDKTHSAISDACLNALRALEPEAPLAQEAKQLLRRLYPAGVQAITQQTHVEQLASNQSILQDLQSAAWSSTAQRLGLTVYVERLDHLQAEFKDALKQAPQADPMVFDEVRAARRRGQALLLQSVALVLGLHPSEDPHDLQARARLLNPVLEQDAAIRAYLSRRRAVADVDPQTGSEEPAP
jgi:hypothetical protein